MELPLLSLPLPTPFGVAHYGILLTDRGTVTGVQEPLAGLPESLFKLTYGKEWEDARAYFRLLAQTLPYRIEAVLFANDGVPKVLLPVVRHYRNHVPDGRPATDYATYWTAQVQDLSLFDFQQRRVDRTLQRLLRRCDLPEAAPHLIPFLISLLPLEFRRTSELAYRVLGATQTETGRSYLLAQLEREGRHPYTQDLLRGLEHYADAGTRRRLAEVYRRGSLSFEQLTTYVAGLGRFPRVEVAGHLEELLLERADATESLLVVFRQLGYTDAAIGQLLRAQLERETDYYRVHTLLDGLLQLSVPPPDLATFNAKLSEPQFLDLPPVNWPQQLEPGWRELLRRTSYPEVLAVIADYLGRPVPRLQRNAVLQLRFLQTQHSEPLALPTELEVRLRELLASRYDKVYVEVMNVLGAKPAPDLADPAAMLDALLEVSLRSRYRFVVLTALRRVGRSEALKERARAFYSRQIKAGKQSAVATLLPYLEKYFGRAEELRSELAQRGGER